MDILKEINPELDGSLSAEIGVDGLPDLACGWVLREYFPAGRLLKLIVPHHPDILLDTSDTESAIRDDDRMPYWAYLWPAAIQMADVILSTACPRGTRVLELGCGLGLVGLSALACGYHVSLTDYDPRSVAVAAINAQLNGFSAFDAFKLDWRAPLDLHYPMIVGCDLLYEARNHSPMLDLLDRMLTPDGVCWLGDAGRNAASEFWLLAQERGFSVIIHDADGEQRQKPGCHFQWFELFR